MKIKCFIFGHLWRWHWKFIKIKNKDGYQYHQRCTRCSKRRFHDEDISTLKK